jgi:polyisoprenyl-phosphate glycosyltransferase
MQTLSVVVPCYNEQEVIEESYRQLCVELEAIAQKFSMGYELIFVNDGSRDNTLSLLQSIQLKHSVDFAQTLGKVKVLALARNFGHQLALTAGLTQARGDAIVAIDADLQDPPAVILKMIERWKEGVDVVYGMRESREGESWFKLLSAKLFYLVVRRLTRINIPLDTGDFRLMSRRALDVFNAMPERNRFIRGMIPWIGFRQEPVHYARSKRFAGVTKYPLSKMIGLALDGITSFSNAPLQTAFLAGVAIAAVSVFFALYIVVREIFFGFPVQGWSSIMVAILFIGSVQLVTIGILGEYVGRIYDEVKKRPMFILDLQASRGFEADQNAEK